MKKGKQNKSNKNRKKYSKIKEQKIEYEEITSLIQTIKNNQNYVFKNFGKFLEIIDDEEYQNEDEIKQEIIGITNSFSKPLYTSLWVIFPKLHMKMITGKNKSELIIALSELAKLAEDQEDLYYFIFPNTNDYPSEIFPFLKDYKTKSDIIMNAVQNKLSNNILDLTNAISDFVIKLTKLIFDWDNSFEELNIKKQKLFYNIAFHEFREVLLYQRSDVTNDRIDETIKKLS